MDKEYLKENIIHERNLKDNFWLAFIATFGASLAIILNSDNVFKVPFALSGFFLSYMLFNAYFKRFLKIENLLSKLKKGE